VKLELGQVAEVLKENVRETREEVAKAEDPDERQRAVDKLQREAAALGQVRAFQDQTAAAKAADRINRVGLSDLRLRYLDAVDDVLGDRVVNPGYRIWLDADHAATCSGLPHRWQWRSSSTLASGQVQYRPGGNGVPAHAGT
jgi:hypothetical protein